jgi:outer membrane lipoprotein-sorting protein
MLSTLRRLLPAYLAGIASSAPLGDAAYAQQAQPPADQLAQTILRRADEVRFPAEGYELTVSVRTTAAGKQTDFRTYRVLSKGNDNTVVMVTEPASERGQIMLMKGRDLWLFLPSVSQPVRLALAQRLTGQVANGDIARANFSGDYTPRVAGTEQVDSETLYVLELTAMDRGVTYQRVRFWVRQRDAWPHKAEFYSLSNRLLKTCTYEDFKQVGGRVRPTRLVMTDALRQREVSVMEYQDIRPRDLPDKIFTKDYLKKLE